MSRDRHFQALRCKLQYRLNLLSRYPKLHHKFIDTHILKVLKDNRNRCPRTSKHNCTASFFGNTFHCGALRPIQDCHCQASIFRVHNTKIVQTPCRFLPAPIDTLPADQTK